MAKAFSKEEVMKKVNLAWVKWVHEATPAHEKDTLKGIIQKLLDKHSLHLDWKTGKVTEQGAQKQSARASSKAGSTKKEAPKQEPKKEKATKSGMSTGDLIKHIFETFGDEWTGKNLRRKIRQMEKWNDGKMTHYDFTEADVKEILTHLGYKVS